MRCRSISAARKSAWPASCAAKTSPEDAVVYLPAEKVLFLGELFDNQYFPRVGSRNVHRWIEVLQASGGLGR